MGRVRTSLVVASLTMAGAALAVVPAVGNAAAAGAARSATTATSASTVTSSACGAVPAGDSTCLVWVRHRGSPQTASPGTGLTPKELETAYSFADSNTATPGKNKTIALVDAYNDPTIASNLSTFSSEYKLPACTTATTCFVKVNQEGKTTTLPKETPGWDVEISLDVEWAHAIAPDAHILLVEATSNSDTNLFDAVEYAAAHATYVSMSWGGGEFSGETTYDSAFSTSSRAFSFFAASGDSRDDVLYPAASPDVIAVGGTTLNVYKTKTGEFDSESVWKTSGAGCSKYETASTAQAAFSTYDNSDCGGKRAIPDVGLDANPTTGVEVYDSVETPSFGSGWVQVGGTSVATPIWAAHSAAAGDRVNAAFVYGSNIKFHDITTGSNGHTCTVGYNLCDGLGSWNTTVGTINGVKDGTLSFTTASPITLSAGERSTALTVTLTPPPSTTVSVKLTSSSSGGKFSATGSTFSTSLTVPVAAGLSPSPSFYYEDTVAGTPTLTASSSGWGSATRTVTVKAGPLASITVSPSSVSLAEGAKQAFTATGKDAHGNAVPITPTWTTTVTGGSLSATTGTTTTLTAGGTAATGKEVTATAATGIHGSATVTVTATPTLTVSATAGTVTHSGRTYRIPLDVTVTGTSGGVRGAKVDVDVYSGSACSGTLAASGSGTTGSSGTVDFTFSTSDTGSFCAAVSATATGYEAGSKDVTFTVAADTKGTKSVRPTYRLT